MKKLLLLIITFTSIQQFYGQSLKSYKHIENDTVYLDFINPFYAPMEVKLSPLDSTKGFIKVNPYSFIKYKDTLKKAVAIPIARLADTSKIHIKSYLKFKANFGDSNRDADNNHAYLLPYPKGKRYKIIQSFGGKFSHNDPHSKYAIDFGTKVGDTITAVRSGKVFFVKEDSKEHCRTRKCINMANKLYILHDDGSMAHYVHLDFEGALVDVGDMVKAGQPIAISGMTGFTTIPHLHLVLYKSGGLSIPFYFKGQKRKKLKQGRFYKRKL
ncbi:M23 family metallopeptidase [Winogradskyella sp.]|uniref:M23 family metallopeptidase n=1 Tax=Winogradskyella sp. TaxID=1883156 RepID=UPI001B08470B|nr:M23 family metallopeptidase [Winogradskyella sp.]MBO6881152.1 M23 family metallopeptidase [Winogradskyella sp.]